MTTQIEGYCTLCRSRCGSLTTVEDGRLVDVQPFPGHPTGGALCAKGRAAPEIAGSPRRLTVPLRRTTPRGQADPGWEEVSWDEALSNIAQRLLRVKEESGAEAVAFAATTPSGTPIVDSIEWIERLTRRFGSPNLVYAVEICGWHKDYAHALTFGRGIGAPDYDNAETIILWGHNPARTWLAQASRIADARSRGAKVVVIDPKKAGSGQQADLWLRIRPGADAALALGGIRYLLTTGAYDSEFLRSWTNAPMLVDDATGRFVRASDLWAGGSSEGYVVQDIAGHSRAYDPERELDRPLDVVLEGTHVLTTHDGREITCRPAFALLQEHCSRWTLEEVSRATTIEVADLRAFYDLLATGRRVAYHSWTGVGQHTNATQTERCIATLYSLLGSTDRPGGNLWLQPPAYNLLSPYADLPEEQQRKALGLTDLPLGPPRFGWVTARHFCRAVLEHDPYRVRALMSFGNNMLVSQADGDRSRQAIEALDFYVHVDLFMNPTAEMADYVLPANTPWERDALRIGFEITQEAVEHVQFRPQMIAPVGESRADYDIAIDLATRLGLGDEFFRGDVRAGWDWQLEPLGLSIESLSAGKHGVRVPQPTSREKYAEARSDGSVTGFNTPTRRVELYSEQLLDHGYRPLPTFVEPIATQRRGGLSGEPLPLVLSTHKNGVYVHTSHRHVASLRRRSPDPHFDISAELATDRGLVDGDWAVLETETGTTRARVRIDEDLHPATVLADYGWWEDCPPLGLARAPISGEGTLNINAVLSDDEHDPTSGSVPMRAVACELQRDDSLSSGNWHGRQRVTVARTWRESDSVVGLTIAPVAGRLAQGFRPGQHVLLAADEHSPSRAYSVTRGGGEHTTLDIAVRRVPEGEVSGVIHEEVREGSHVWLERPQGTFTPPLTTDRPVVLLAGGVGVTPFLGYLRSLHESSDRPPSVTLLRVFRNSREHPFRQEFEQLAADLPELTTRVWYSQPLADDELGVDYDVAGRLSLEGIDLPVEKRPLVYLCGAAGLMDQVTQDLVDRGVPRFDIFREDFHSIVEVPPDLAPAEIRFASGADPITWDPSDGSILSAADRQGKRLPSGCRVGQCESCALRVLDGSVAHVGESPADDVVLTCIAVPVGDVTLDA